MRVTIYWPWKCQQPTDTGLLPLVWYCRYSISCVSTHGLARISTVHLASIGHAITSAKFARRLNVEEWWNCLQSLSFICLRNTQTVVHFVSSLLCANCNHFGKLNFLISASPQPLSPGWKLRPKLKHTRRVSVSVLIVNLSIDEFLPGSFAGIVTGAV